MMDLDRLRLPDDWRDKFKCPDEHIIDPNGDTHCCPRGTLRDLEFLASCGIDPWSSLGMVTYVIGQKDHWAFRREIGF